MDVIIKFQQVLATMQELMEDTSKLFISFWKELQDESPNFQYLGDTSHIITKNVNSIRQNYTTLIKITPSNLYCRMLYALFLKRITKDEFEAFDVFEE